ncbi:NAD(P)-binding domain protein [Cordyceps fumosorosea ARSEF 2679]|uniref:NAD(P)-binding domain protein n=1 Tax=Cordyceps fumosorosea (strain ARSEF 2679) TaxID=1081104 RepID=A0A162I9B4_CORFA|nr:NAD(P)-binding domain protein [Cordyceps fumosorosea ARSEF 2679]OAA54005.1 NAD(P)-binding domain protein [Cordyceps fumosorosea ARSEF 2679]
MHIYITGGTGRNGSLAISAALDRGHTVTALVRSPTSSTPPRPGLTLVTGSPLSQADVRRALTTGPSPPSAVIFTLGLPRTSTSPFAPLRPNTPADLLSRAASTLLAAIDAIGGPAPKIVVNSTLGAGDSWAALAWPFKVLFSRTPMRFGVEDHDKVDKVVREGGRRFVLARAGRLTEQKEEGAEPAPVRVLPDDGKGLGFMDALTRQSLALWLVLAAEQDTWDGRSPVLVN